MVRFVLYALTVAALLFWPLPQLHTPTSLSAAAAPASPVVSVALVAPKKPEPVPVAPRPEKKTSKPQEKPKPKPEPKPKAVPEKEPKPVPEPEPRPEATPPEPPVPAPVADAEPEASSPSAPAAAVQAPAVDATAARASARSDYYGRVYATIAAEKRYPKKARRFHHQGTVKVRFALDRAGTVTQMQIIESSGYRTLDGAVSRLFRDLGAFEPPPPELETPLVMQIAINYTLGE